MKIKISVLLATLLCLIGLHESVRAQGGCPPEPSPVGTSQYRTIEAVMQIAPAVPQTTSPQARGSFYQNRLIFTYKPSWRVLLSSTPDGTGPLCSDDYVEIQASSGRVYSHDYRSPAHDVILPTAPVDITFLFEVGEQEAVITLIDLMAPDYSSSPYFLVAVSDPIRPTSTATVTATVTRKPTATGTPTLTLTPTLAPSPSPTPPAAGRVSGSRPFPAPLPILVGVLILVAGVILATRQNGRRLPSLVGWEVEVRRLNQWLTTVWLSEFPNQPQVTVGPAGDIPLPNRDGPEVLPEVVARIRPGADERRPCVDLLGLDGDVMDSREVYHGDEVVLPGDYRLVFRNWAEEDNIPKGEDYV